MTPVEKVSASILVSDEAYAESKRYALWLAVALQPRAARRAGRRALRRFRLTSRAIG